ncbi:MAG: [FeFe] hydrogenase H-cluster maturation GTPase HydF [Ileibacterium sp.]|nr:[FeFe] hydrogenase H-cluster maturation GTPase HydF [Ileibacterium sp.]
MQTDLQKIEKGRQRMSLNSTPSSERIHIGFFGCRNAGKSSLVNAVTGQDLAVVSEVKGTTTDPVIKAMEILPLGPVVIIDTPGFDDEGMLGELRVAKTKQILNKTDIAVLVTQGSEQTREMDDLLVGLFQQKNIPYLIACTKSDLLDDVPQETEKTIWVSAENKTNIHALKEKLGKLAPKDHGRRICADLLEQGDTVVLVCPIDESAPKGRMILPQQQTIRDVLDADSICLVTKETELEQTLKALKQPPKLVITDSQALGFIKDIVPADVCMTTFSILMARYKGFLETAVEGISHAKDLKDGDVILMAEGCTHHRQCNDIGTVKIPNQLRRFTGKELVFETCSGRDFPEDLSRYAMVIHCGACMLSERDVLFRMKSSVDQQIPFTNYGIALAHLTGTLCRTLQCFPQLQNLLQD